MDGMGRAHSGINEVKMLVRMPVTGMQFGLGLHPSMLASVGFWLLTKLDIRHKILCPNTVEW